MKPLPARALLALGLAVALGGCATLSPQPRAGDLNPLLEQRGGPGVDWAALGDPAEAPAPVGQWLAEPMTLDAALRIAMLRSPRLQEEYARLGLARAEVLDAVEIGNPRLGFQRLALDDGGHKRTVGLSLPLVDLLLAPVRGRLAAQDYDRARYDVADAVLGIRAEVEAAWYRYVAARQVAGMREAVAEGLDASAELARRFRDAGNISALQLAQEQAAASQARIDALHARAGATRERLALTTLLGLRDDERDWEAADTLPLPVPAEDGVDELLALARANNLALMAARRQAEVQAEALGLTRTLRWLGDVEVGYERETEASGERLRGPDLSLELPIFNQGQARLAKAQAQLAEALARVRLAEMSTEGGVRTGVEAVAAMREVVRLHREALVPQREAIVDRQQERQNFMLIGVFELIQAKVEEYDAYQAYLESVRDYWLARVELARAVGQRLPSDAAIGPRTPALDEILSPTEAGMDHSKHQGMDHSQHQGMDHSQHQGMDHSQHQGMDHSRHEGVDQAPPEQDDDDAPPAGSKHDHHHGAQP